MNNDIETKQIDNILLVPAPDTLGTLPAVGEPGEPLPGAGDTGGVADLVAEEALHQAALNVCRGLSPVVRHRPPPVLAAHEARGRHRKCGSGPAYDNQRSDLRI